MRTPRRPPAPSSAPPPAELPDPPALSHHRPSLGPTLQPVGLFPQLTCSLLKVKGPDSVSLTSPQQPQVQEVEVTVETLAPVCRKKSQEKKSSLRRAFSHKKHSSKEPKKAGTVPEAGTLKRPSFLPLCVGGHRSSISSSAGEQAWRCHGNSLPGGQGWPLCGHLAFCSLLWAEEGCGVGRSEDHWCTGIPWHLWSACCMPLSCISHVTCSQPSEVHLKTPICQMEKVRFRQTVTRRSLLDLFPQSLHSRL